MRQFDSPTLPLARLSPISWEESSPCKSLSNLISICTINTMNHGAYHAEHFNYILSQFHIPSRAHRP
jgi:hypothetical protein